MDKSYNDNIRPLLDLADSLPALLKGTSIRIPRIASCGMQSHGKSSTLESITHIPLPQGNNTVTICPIKISLRNAKDKEYARIKFELDSDDNYETIQLSQISEKIDEYQKKVKKKNNVKENETRLFDEVIQVEVNRKNAPNLTLYDMPGINFKEDIQKKSEEINEKYLREKETTVLLVISGSEEPLNCYSTKWMKQIPDYRKRFNAIITKADLLIDSESDKYDSYLEQINSLELENPPSLVINKCKKYENLSYNDMEGEEIRLINRIPHIDRYPNVNKGIQALIAHLIKLQKEDLLSSFSDIATKIKKEIVDNKKMLKKFPSSCESKEQFFEILKECLNKFKAQIESIKDILLCDQNGQPESNLLKYDIQLRFRRHIKNAKEKINSLFTLPFCTQITNNIVQYNSFNIPILEDVIAFNKLLKPKVEEVLSDFELTINDIYDYMICRIKPIIAESFNDYKHLERKVSKLYTEFAKKQKKEILDLYEKIYSLETKNIESFNISIIDKVNNLNKHINFLLFHKEQNKGSKVLKKIGNIVNNVYEKGIKKIIPAPISGIIDTGKDIVKTSVNNEDNSSEQKKNEDDEFFETNSNFDEKEINEENNKNNNNNTNKDVEKEQNGENKKEDNVFKTIDNLTNQVTENKNFGEVVKNKYKQYSKLVKSEITNNYNYEKEKEVRNFDQQIFTGRIKIAYRPTDIETFYERIIDQEVLKLTESNEIEFIPGFQYINKDKLKEFYKIIIEAKVQPRAANVITKMAAYLEIMLSRNLDIIFLGIQKYLYDRLTDDEMIDYIRNNLHLLEFEKCKTLLQVNPESDSKRKECLNNIKNLKEVMKKLSELKNDKNIIFYDDDLEEEEENEEEEEKEGEEAKDDKNEKK